MSLSEKTDAEILNIANPIMDNLMDASSKIDHERHTRDFTDRLKAIVTKEHLEKVCQQYQSKMGFFTERELVAIFRRPNGVAIVWRQRFSLQPGEFAAEILLKEIDGRFLVDHALVW